MERALVKIHALPDTVSHDERRYSAYMFRSGSLGALFSTHPSLDARREALRSGRYLNRLTGRETASAAPEVETFAWREPRRPARPSTGKLAATVSAAASWRTLSLLCQGTAVTGLAVGLAWSGYKGAEALWPRPVAVRPAPVMTGSLSAMTALPRPPQRSPRGPKGNRLKARTPSPRPPVKPAPVPLALRQAAQRAGLHPELAPEVLLALTAADLQTAATAVLTAFNRAEDGRAFAWPPRPEPNAARFVVMMHADAKPGCRAYRVTMTKAGRTAATPSMRLC